MSDNYKIRNSVVESDIKLVEEIVRSTKYFRPDEEKIAVELVEDRVLHGDKSDYLFCFLEVDGKTVGYSCFGLIPCSLISYDLYWIVVHDDCRGKGYGKYLMKETEKCIKSKGGAQVYVETSSKEQYKSTRVFYEKCTYIQLALFEDFYDYGDGKLVYFKKL